MAVNSLLAKIMLQKKPANWTHLRHFGASGKPCTFCSFWGVRGLLWAPIDNHFLKALRQVEDRGDFTSTPSNSPLTLLYNATMPKTTHFGPKLCTASLTKKRKSATWHLLHIQKQREGASFSHWMPREPWRPRDWVMTKYGNLPRHHPFWNQMHFEFENH